MVQLKELIGYMFDVLMKVVMTCIWFIASMVLFYYIMYLVLG